MASKICDTPIALISLIDDKRQRFKSCYDLEPESTPKEISFCQHAIKSDEIYEIENALESDLFKQNPEVSGDPKIHFYAGVPFKTRLKDKILEHYVLLTEKQENLQKNKKAYLNLLPFLLSVNWS
jgi:hypothetical protein